MRCLFFARLYSLVRTRSMLLLCHAHLLCKGILSGSALMIKLSEDRVLPKAMANRIKLTGAPYLAIAIFLLLDALIYASCTANLNILSQMLAPSALFHQMLVLTILNQLLNDILSKHGSIPGICCSSEV